ncbi:MAG TPA: UDP-N-acetylglucosamine 2-epimerase (non-hydrolyzing) [Patescibacteria group bacterium]|nr:UDP-N-acetylglucosamine 2-epimerase (non-hydrolyzing) [Patescibacteria group bacterium]
MPCETPRILVVFGTRPEIIKLAPVVAALRQKPGIETVVCSTGQQRELAAQTLAVFDLTADFDLQLMRERQDLHDIVAGALCGTRDIIAQVRPSFVLVQGDTGSAVGAGLAAYYSRIPLGHVEAGLRTNDMFNPFPEEANRRLLDEVSSLLFAPTPRARDVLLREGVAAERVHLTGNTVVDALMMARQGWEQRGAPATAAGLLASCPGKKLLLTCHRRENFGDGLAAIFDGVADIARRYPDLTVLFPVHPNPTVRDAAQAHLGGVANVRLLGQLPYPDFLYLLSHADLVISDSGGVQEEAPSFGTPLMVVRRQTERMEGVEGGFATIARLEAEDISRHALELLAQGRRPPTVTTPYGDGHAAQRIADLLTQAVSG